MIKKSTQVAMGGLCAGLCVMLMFMTGLVPFAIYALPAAAGAVLIAVVVENGKKTAVVVYIAVSLLSLFVVPDREAAIMYIFVFGYYSIIKSGLDKIRPKPLSYIVKLIIFNISAVMGYLIVIYVLGIPDVLSEFGRYSALILLGCGNIVFLIYDFLIGNLFKFYVNVFRVKYLSRM